MSFFYYKISDSGCFSVLTSNIAWGEFFGAEKNYLIDPYLRHPKFFQSGVVLLHNKDEDSVLRMINSQKFNRLISLFISNRTADGLETFGFASNSFDDNQVSLLLSELPLLRMFFKKFREENRAIFRAVDENQIDLAKLIGPSFYENGLKSASPSSARDRLLQDLGMLDPSSLTSREVGVVKLLLQGLSASKIALQVHLSKRTVEHHIERIKEKLGCDSKAELIQKARELEQFGCLDMYESRYV